MSNFVGGRVIVEGSREGIPDLVVAVYDLDPLYANEFADPVTADDGLPEGWLQDWFNRVGDRIGSVRTDGQGYFSLTYEDDAYRVRNPQEKRPDLVLLVEAPDSASTNNKRPSTVPVGRRTLDRLLHVAAFPRSNSGRIEHYVIAIDPARLRGHDITVGSFEAPTADQQRAVVAAALEKAAPVRERIEAVKAKSWQWLAPKALVDAERFVAPGEDPSVAHGTAMTAGFQRLAKLPARRQTFRIDDTALTRVLNGRGVAPQDIGTEEGVTVSLCDLLGEKGLSQSLERVRGLLTARHAQREADLATTGVAAQPGLPGAAAPTGGPSGSNGATPASHAHELDSDLTGRVLGQVAELPAIGHDGHRSMLAELAKIKETISSLELSGGPANVTAFHDIHSLQVAFEDVWTAAFDDTLSAKVLDLYRQTVKVHVEHGLELPNLEEIDDANQLRGYLASLRGECELADLEAVPPELQRVFPQLTSTTWNRLDEVGRRVLQNAALNHTRPWSSGDDINPPVQLWTSQEYLDEQYERATRYHLNSRLAQIERLLLDIGDRLHEPYNFTYYAPYTINYGMLSTYRQEWVPDSYQVGRLVSTIPLAPGEARRLKVTKSLKKTRAEKAVERALFESSEERQFSSRAELDVITKVQTATNFQLTAQGSFNIGIGSIGASSTFAANQAQESSRQQRAFAENTRKAAEQVRQEREITVESTDETEAAIESAHELANPNNELTVTYLLYELERRYHINARLHKLTPVVLVALDMPAPHEITEGWLLEHDWIIRRVLLDDALTGALDYVRDGLTAATLGAEIKKANWIKQQALVDQLEGQIDGVRAVRAERREQLIDLQQRRDLAEQDQLSEGERIAQAIFSGGISELFGGGQSNTGERIEAMRAGVEQALEFVAEETARLEERLGATRRELTVAADAYNAAIVEKERKDTRVSQLRLHVRQNIFHYMHAIWEMTHPDQRFFELNDRMVPFVGDEGICTLRRATDAEQPESVPFLDVDGDAYVVECAPPEPATVPARRLGEIADLDQPLGFKGNYAIFPLRECSHITHFMTHAAIDDYFGIRDPYTGDGYTTEELLEYARDIVNTQDPNNPLSAQDLATLREFVAAKLTRSQSLRETVILPTGELYMEALKGDQALLENFKLAHRGLDVLKVQEEVRGARLENLRRAARLVAGEPLLEDPDIDKRIVVDGHVGSIDLES